MEYWKKLRGTSRMEAFVLASSLAPAVELEYASDRKKNPKELLRAQSIEKMIWINELHKEIPNLLSNVWKPSFVADYFNTIYVLLVVAKNLSEATSSEDLREQLSQWSKDVAESQLWFLIASNTNGILARKFPSYCLALLSEVVWSMDQQRALISKEAFSDFILSIFRTTTTVYADISGYAHWETDANKAETKSTHTALANFAWGKSLLFNEFERDPAFLAEVFLFHTALDRRKELFEWADTAYAKGFELYPVFSFGIGYAGRQVPLLPKVQWNLMMNPTRVSMLRNLKQLLDIYGQWMNRDATDRVAETIQWVAETKGSRLAQFFYKGS